MRAVTGLCAKVVLTESASQLGRIGSSGLLFID